MEKGENIKAKVSTMVFYIFALLHKRCDFKEKLLILIGIALGTLELLLLRIFIAIVDWGMCPT
jgi:hypothetical protein